MVGKRRRTLTPEELELWTRVTRFAEPLSSRTPLDSAVEASVAEPSKKEIVSAFEAPAAPMKTVEDFGKGLEALEAKLKSFKPKSSETTRSREAMGKRGGKARAEKMTPDRRDEPKIEGRPAAIAASREVLSTPPATPSATGMRYPAVPPAAPFDLRIARHLARGRQPIDARLDLHGLRQQDAYVTLRQFLSRCQIAGHRHVLVITGKGAPAAAGDGEFWRGGERGVLRRLVPQWLREPELRAIAVSNVEAAQHHGGGGALYVTIRRRRG